MTTSELKSLNNLRKNYVKPKQKLLVYSKPTREKTAESTVSSVPARSSDNRKDTSSVRVTSTVNPSPASSENTGYHVVKNGENLGIIASRYHCTIDQIKTWNNLKTDKLIVGQKVRVNASSKQETSYFKQDPNAGKPSKPPSSATNKITVYTIQPGDNLWEIADKFDVTVSQIKTLNNLTNANRLKPGQKIKIP